MKVTSFHGAVTATQTRRFPSFPLAPSSRPRTRHSATLPLPLSLARSGYESISSIPIMQPKPKTLPATTTSLPKRKKVPSQAPLRIFKKKLRDLQRLIKKQAKDSAKNLPEEVLQDAEEKANQLEERLKVLHDQQPEEKQAYIKIKSSHAIRMTGARETWHVGLLDVPHSICNRGYDMISRPCAPFSPL